jgi:predicted DNA-binding transcriptional regulator AlpA
MLRDYPGIRQSAKAAPNFGGTSTDANHTESGLVTTGQSIDCDRRPAHEKLLGAKEVAHWLGVSRAWVFEHSNGRRRPFLPSVKLGKSVRYRPIDVDAFIVECERFSRKGAA